MVIDGSNNSLNFFDKEAQSSCIVFYFIKNLLSGCWNIWVPIMFFGSIVAFGFDLLELKFYFIFEKAKLDHLNWY